MGGGLACHRPLPSLDLREPRHRGAERKLSAVCNFHDAPPGAPSLSERVNVNLASEEELMTLPGVTRAVAHSLVEYRREIAGFRKVEDVALVPGVGAAKLEAMRMEICVGSPGALSIARLVSRDSRPDLLATTRININSATPAQLASVRGVSEKLAERVAHHRAEHGPFRTVDDLVRVRGISASLIERVRAQVYAGLSSRPPSFCAGAGVGFTRKGGGSCGSGLGGSGPIPSPTSRSLRSLAGAERPVSLSCQPNWSEGMLPAASVRAGEHAGPGRERRRRRRRQGSWAGNGPAELAGSSAPPSPGEESEEGSTDDRCPVAESGSSCDAGSRGAASGGPTSSSPLRPAVRPFSGLHRGRPVVRLGSWNLQRCSREKSSNPGVREVVCMTLLESGVSLLAVQELMDTEALKKLCLELNEPTVPLVQSWAGQHGDWECVTSAERQPDGGREILGFLWNRAAGVELLPLPAPPDCAGMIPSNGTGASCRVPLLVRQFKVGAFAFTAVNVHVRPAADEGTAVQLPPLGPALLSPEIDGVKGGWPVLVLGGLGAQAASALGGLPSVLPPEAFTDIGKEKPGGSRAADGVWVSSSVKERHTGGSAVVRAGLSSAWIPDGWAWGGFVSDHCPVWAEFFTDFPRGKAEDVRSSA
uniref:Endonuclease/exonuclease/phosphatase family domain-containing protein 1 n=1 Tax=Petromyzon marinus TaxID=7757 RepID=A0AAJ7WXT3_PETMA|nr:endonuclease/exonuclease/phosphatase family domain-containing protein 1-like isoform X1 [Petromyzon marinus]XP_032813743.1 endonuclease/exonuclease/phosphatase family domain-containing protein 1-like isoform X1 [Petromyzon marinus]XP_032813744.1 endonuclease/exonuclease/phosphatase family domain-containing protein 1-like isoform X1 [Petromyzon marinus]